MPTNNEAERIIADKFSVGKSFVYKNDFNKILLSGKPAYSSGEGKTDLYLKTQVKDGVTNEFKISIKKDNYEFLENKIKKDRAIEILGSSALSIISAASKSLDDEIKKIKLVQIKKDGTYEILLGWKLELFFNTTRKLKASLNLSKKQKKEVLCGTHLPSIKKNATVCGQLIPDSGEANFILEIPSNLSLLKALNINDLSAKFQTPDELINSAAFDINAGFTALNYRSNKDKWDGPRPLAIWVNWQIVNNKLSPYIEYDTPLELDGNDVGYCLKKSLKSFKIGSCDCQKLLSLIVDQS